MSEADSMSEVDKVETRSSEGQAEEQTGHESLEAEPEGVVMEQSDDESDKESHKSDDDDESDKESQKSDDDDESDKESHKSDDESDKESDKSDDDKSDKDSEKSDDDQSDKESHKSHDDDQSDNESHMSHDDDQSDKESHMSHDDKVDEESINAASLQEENNQEEVTVPLDNAVFTEGEVEYDTSFVNEDSYVVESLELYDDLSTTF
eukprot:CAMPEP_0184655666 /NCGR_PEP_ID=MMETSP0308-20130426/14312_1 /TAXON_ID=38269 /ORGANISM="Gloeochaete witrockiana, Strain SAG 46.84" /LENGTH=206 /DNA_ID=CAMNT_0027092317 /DNA_START=95 /DNA_END=715 /DNA_ORIENTATION=-